MIQQKFTNGPQKPTNELQSNTGQTRVQDGYKWSTSPHGTDTGPKRVRRGSKQTQGISTLEKEKQLTSVSKTQPNLLVGPRAMKDEEFMAWALSYGLESCMQNCKPKFTLLLPVEIDGLNGAGGVERIDTTVGPSSKST